MIKKLLCKIGIHTWIIKKKYYPNTICSTVRWIDAPPVIQFLVTRTCERCGKYEILQDDRFDKSGEPLEDQMT